MIFWRCHHKETKIKKTLDIEDNLLEDNDKTLTYISNQKNKHEPTIDHDNIFSIHHEEFP